MKIELDSVSVLIVEQAVLNEIAKISLDKTSAHTYISLHDYIITIESYLGILKQLAIGRELYV